MINRHENYLGPPKVLGGPGSRPSSNNGKSAPVKSPHNLFLNSFFYANEWKAVSHLRVPLSFQTKEVCVFVFVKRSIPPPEIKRCQRKLELAVKTKECTVKRSTGSETTGAHMKECESIVFVHLETVKSDKVILYSSSCVYREGPAVRAARRAD